jgi:primosomal protein N' (replication factor Y)
MPTISKKRELFVDVVVDLPVEGEFTYSVPEELALEVQVGKRALVPFGKRKLTGYIVKIKEKTEVKRVKPIIELLDLIPLFDSTRLKFFTWLSSYYFSTLGEALALIHPKFVNIKSERVFKLTPAGVDALKSGALERDEEAGSRLLSFLKQPKNRAQILKLFEGSIPRGLLAALKSDGLIIEDMILRGGTKRRTEKFYQLAEGIDPEQTLKGLKRAPSQGALINYLSGKDEPISLKKIKEDTGNAASALSALKAKGVVEEVIKDAVVEMHHEVTPGRSSEAFELSTEQRHAVSEIEESIKKGGFNPFLLYGVTGSGKTLVYLLAIEEALRSGKAAIVLVPEINLTSRAVAWLTGRFKGRVALMHSALNDAERFYQFQRILSGDANVVIGTRSALFSPVRDLGLIIVDEEHETSYKQEEGVRYSARDSALKYAKDLGLTVVLGSATPSVETFHNAALGKIKRLDLTRRVTGMSMPRIDIEDMRGTRRDVLFSDRLLELIGQTLERGEQTLLFLNRRGFSNFLICSGCGHAFDCPNCSVTLTYHKRINRLRCHYCDVVERVPESCPSCGDEVFDNPGFGTEKVEEELRLIFPEARIGRMDRDTTRRRGAAHAILDAMDNLEIDILIGTQMVSKGHDFPGITLVGVISGDTSLNIPDFRGAERTFQLIAQAAGRAGRGDKEARVLVQTLNPDHFCFLSAIDHDYGAFFASEIEEREGVLYPPFSRLCSIRLDGVDERRLEKSVMRMKSSAEKIIKEKKYAGLRVLGPAPALVFKVRGRYRWQFLVKAEYASQLVGFVRELKRGFNASADTGVRLLIDMDPLTTV